MLILNIFDVRFLVNIFASNEIKGLPVKPTSINLKRRSFLKGIDYAYIVNLRGIAL